MERTEQHQKNRLPKSVVSSMRRAVDRGRLKVEKAKKTLENLEAMLDEATGSAEFVDDSEDNVDNAAGETETRRHRTR